jgi:nucleoside-diphosphate-sugar epimerase
VQSHGIDVGLAALMPHAVVFGARGQIGRFLLPRLLAAGWRIDAVTRAAGPRGDEHAAVAWHTFDLFGSAAPALPGDVLFSLGPLDGLVAWLQRADAVPQRVIAFGSTSAATKQASPDAHERALAQRLGDSEAALARVCAERALAWTLLRPTLVYGAGMDRNLTRIAQIARRCSLFVLPRNAVGLRQPVHAEDLAAAAWCAAHRAASIGQSYDLPGGETLAYRDMVARVLACLEPAPRMIMVSALTFDVLLALARFSGALSDAGRGVVARLQDDLVFDAAPARRDLDFHARNFQPHGSMF